MFDGPLADILQTSNPELSENSARIRRYLNSYKKKRVRKDRTASFGR